MDGDPYGAASATRWSELELGRRICEGQRRRGETDRGAAARGRKGDSAGVSGAAAGGDAKVRRRPKRGRRRRR